MTRIARMGKGWISEEYAKGDGGFGPLGSQRRFKSALHSKIRVICVIRSNPRQNFRRACVLVPMVRYPK
jgi:hypothetical protein